MKIVNKLMQAKLNKLGEYKIDFEIKGELSFLWPDFYEVEGLFLMTLGEEDRLNAKDLETILSYENYKSEYEAGCSEYRIQDYFEDLDDEQKLKMGLVVSEMWALKLKELFPQNEFHIILSETDGEVTLRYHCFREEEGAWLDEGELDGYEDEAIMIRIVGQKG